jgi:hypothetical protein
MGTLSIKDVKLSPKYSAEGPNSTRDEPNGISSGVLYAPASCPLPSWSVSFLEPVGGSPGDIMSLSPVVAQVGQRMFKLPSLASDVRGAFDHQQWWATAWASIRL